MIFQLLSPAVRLEDVPIGDGKVGATLNFDDLITTPTPQGMAQMPTGLRVTVGPLTKDGLADLGRRLIAHAEGRVHVEIARGNGTGRG